MNILGIIKNLELDGCINNVYKFNVGDTVVVKIEIKDSIKGRFQLYEGVVISKKNRSINSSFIVRKICSNEGVERTFQLHSPLIKDIIVKKSGLVKKSKLYYQIL